jgi:tripartite-type tricarboxylate transporter receptor subunit TctC
MTHQPDTTRRRLTTALALGAALGVPASAARAQQAGDFPSRPIKIIVPFNAGSGADANSRFYGDLLGKRLGTTVLVENRPGGSGIIAIQAVRSAPADGHMIMQASNSPMTVNAVTIKDLPYDPVKDFRPVHGLSKGAVALIVKGDSPHKTINDLVGTARREKRPITVGNYSAGYQLIAAWLGTATSVPVTHVPYKGGAQMMNDIVGGQVEIGAIDFSGAVPLIKEGRLRALALTGAERHPDYPDIPTMKESGYPDFETYVWSSFFVRSETPDAITSKLVDAMKAVMVSPEAKAYQATQPSAPLLFGPQEMREFQLAELKRFRNVADLAGIKPQ